MVQNNCSKTFGNRYSEKYTNRAHLLYGSLSSTAIIQIYDRIGTLSAARATTATASASTA